MANVVMVEDDEAIRALHATVLRASGHRVIERGDTDGLLELLHDEEADIVLLDLSLPRENGLSACQRIKADPTLKNLRVVMVTAHDSFEAIRQSTAAGADGHLVKPVPMERLRAVVDPTHARRPAKGSSIGRAFRSILR